MAEAFGILDYHNPGVFNGCRFSVRKYLYDQTDLINTVCDQIKCDKILKYCLGQRKGRYPKCLYKYKTLSCGSLWLLIYMLVRYIMIFIWKPLISFEKQRFSLCFQAPRHLRHISWSHIYIYIYVKIWRKSLCTCSVPPQTYWAIS